MLLLHFPTFLLLIGTVVFWGELILHTASHGHATIAAPTIAGLFLVYATWKTRCSLPRIEWKTWSFSKRFIWGAGALLCAGILMVSLWASLLPPHLMQEMDALNYHYTLPRQHLILGSFAHLPWSVADLWTHSLQFALAPYWFVTSLPNKIPQFIFMLGLWAMAARVAFRIAPAEHKGKSAALAVMALAGSHGLGIQYGTAMLDIVGAYLALAALSSYEEGHPLLASLELSFLIWSKSFMVLQVPLVLIAVAMGGFLLKRNGFHLVWAESSTSDIDTRNFLRFSLGVLVFGVMIGGPFVLKSFYYTGTPLYPFGMGIIPAPHPSVEVSFMKSAADSLQTVRDAYGNGRSVVDFLVHFWRVAVPTQGVNNEFDYPLGLPILLLLVPFAWQCVKAIKSKKYPIMNALAVVFWAAWWMGSQQSRWLFIPMALMFVSVPINERIADSKTLSMILLLSVSLTLLSMVRSNKMDIGLWGEDVLRPMDRDLVRAQSPLVLDFKEAMYAPVPITVREKSKHFVFPLVEKLNGQLN